MFPGPRPLTAKGSALDCWGQSIRTSSLIPWGLFRHLCKGQTKKKKALKNTFRDICLLWNILRTVWIGYIKSLKPWDPCCKNGNKSAFLVERKNRRTKEKLHLGVWLVAAVCVLCWVKSLWWHSHSGPKAADLFILAEWLFAVEDSQFSDHFSTPLLQTPAQNRVEDHQKARNKLIDKVLGSNRSLVIK